MPKIKEVLPCGILSCPTGKYLLLKPYPIVGDNWEGDNCYRWLVIPIDPRYDTGTAIYSYARHVVTNSFSIEYRSGLTPIQVEVEEESDD
jgi:hypothetical protein